MPKISIIIPVFNRQDLVAATLDSILIQTFTDWECVLVDDHSSDSSVEVLESYQKKDNRFKVYKRPIEYKKGANSCRNYGFTQSKGAFVKWFDSDDLMLECHLEIAYATLVENKLDFVITDTLNFDHETREFLGKPYEFDKSKLGISAQNLALEQIGWITDDFLCRREVVENIKFNENITTDGDEYNFFVRLLHVTTKGFLSSQIVTHRRVHNNSLTKIHGIENSKYFIKIANIKFQTAKDLIVYENRELIRWFLSGYMQFGFKLSLNKEKLPHYKPAFSLICKYYSIPKGVAFIFALLLAKYSNKGYNIMKYART
jgi:glycosyltransferase involved in cell wall biosynthesis